MSSKSRKKRNAKKKKSIQAEFSHRYRKTDHEKSFSQWDNDVEKALKGDIPEEERSEIATKEALLKCLQKFTERLTFNFDRFDTNLGLVLETRTSVAGSLVIYGTGENGTNEFVPIVLTVNAGVPQNVEEHIDFLTTGKWHSMTLPPKEDPKIEVFKPQLVRAPKSAGIR